MQFENNRLVFQAQMNLLDNFEQVHLKAITWFRNTSI